MKSLKQDELKPGDLETKPVIVHTGFSAAVADDRNPGHMVSLLFCSENQNEGMWIDRVSKDTGRCAHCNRDHPIVSVLDALRGGKLDVQEGGPVLWMNDLVVVQVPAPSKVAGVSRR